MDKNRFKRSSNYSTPTKHPVPKLDEMGELRIVDDKAAENEAGQVSSPVASVENQVENPAEPITEPIAENHIKRSVVKRILPLKRSKKQAVQTDYNVSQIQTAAAPMMAQSTMAPSISSPSTQETNINININLPKIPELKLKKPALPKLPDLPYKKIAIYSSIVIAVLAIALSIILLTHHTPKPKPVVSSAASPGLGLSAPTFTPVAPKDKPQLANGIEGTTFDGSRDTYSYTDVLNGTPLVVSQQPIPSKYATANQAVVAAAKSIGATTVVPATNATAYMATNNASKSQIIVFSMKNILLFIQSYFTHPASLWADYINNLQ